MTLAERIPLPSKLGLLAALGSGALLGGLLGYAIGFYFFETIG